VVFDDVFCNRRVAISAQLSFMPVYRLQGALGSSSPNINFKNAGRRTFLVSTGIIQKKSQKNILVVEVAAMFVPKAKDRGAPLKTGIQM
jgi:hypothetical protein